MLNQSDYICYSRRWQSKKINAYTQVVAMHTWYSEPMMMYVTVQKSETHHVWMWQADGGCVMATQSIHRRWPYNDHIVLRSIRWTWFRGPTCRFARIDWTSRRSCSGLRSCPSAFPSDRIGLTSPVRRCMYIIMVQISTFDTCQQMWCVWWWQIALTGEHGHTYMQQRLWILHMQSICTHERKAIRVL